MSKQESLKDTLGRLREIVDWFKDAEAVDVEAGLEQVKEGAGLVKQARERFEEIENEFEDVKAELEDGEEDN